MSENLSKLKIILSANTDWYIYNFRLSLAKAIKQAGAEILLISPPGSYASRISEQGFDWKPLNISRRSMNPLQELATLLAYLALYRREQPSLVHHFTIKPVLYGSLAARILNVPAVVNSVTGLGYVFVNPGRFAALLRILVKPFYRIALSAHHSRVIFQNQRDRDLFVGQELVSTDRTLIIPGSGVDPNQFKPRLELLGEPVILMASRMLWDKGVGELVEAARLLRQRGIAGKIVLVGGTDEGNPASVSSSQLRKWQDEGIIEWLGHRDDMPGIMASAHIVVLPSYGEGLPKVLIEAGAAGKPVVATDVQGCRDIIQHGVNGLLVPPKNAVALAEALNRLIDDAELREKMGVEARKLILESYTNDHINRQTLELYRKMIDGWPG